MNDSVLESPVARGQLAPGESSKHELYWLSGPQCSVMPAALVSQMQLLNAVVN